MAKIDPRIRLTEDEIRAFLETETRCRLATLGPGAAIHLTPMTFGFAAERLYIFGRGQKIANLRRDPTATVLIDIGDAWRSLKGLMMPGQARVLETVDDETNDPHLSAAMDNIGNKHGRPYQACASGNSRRWIVFTPERFISWDNAKL